MWGKINYNLSRKTIIGKKLTNNEKDISHMIQEFESIEKMMSVIYSEKNEGRVIFCILLLLIGKLDLGYVESYYFHYDEESKTLQYKEGYFNLDKIEEEELDEIYDSLSDIIEVDQAPFLKEILEIGEPVYDIKKFTELTPYTFLSRLNNFSVIPVGYADKNYGVLIMAGNKKLLKMGKRKRELVDIFKYNLSMYLYNRDLEKKELKDDRLKTIGYFANSIVHEFKTPVSVIKGFATLAKNKLDDPEKLKIYLENIINESDRIIEMSDEVGEYAQTRNSLSIEEEFYFQDVVKEIYKKFKNKFERLEIKPIFMEEKKILVKANKKTFSRTVCHILKNVAENVDYKKDNRYILFRFEEQDGRDVVVFEDNGCGIPEDNLSKVFSPFYTTKINGTGLGMTIVKEYYEKIGMEIKLESVCGKYTKLTVIL
ncbi:sensor histidine kinase [Ilyobacter polytropus]|uniref:histidine kinase n=1 Tax=Ilyobacter polytropus (strain ATCC 51220 / DSM 2926 / LMG 16218 / CuHBu1) TaxID=572544 RepID=E3HB98_ILYPC|nr:HAMP domain-containing sensor histidine kinase [Ilyobacter polytropus]ADO82249.1 histidine kinase [Ilyobacter polytropus DSM 2926]